MSASVTTITTSAADQFSAEPYSSVPMAGTPPAAYWMPTRTSASPISVTTRPVTSGGSAKRMRPMKVPMQAWNSPPISTPPNRAASASTPLPATSGIMIGRNAKLVPWTIGSAAPTGPIVTVCSNVATPAKSIDIWIRYSSSGKSGELEPKPNPAAPARMIAGVTLDTNIAMTCWMPSGIACASGGV